ncbi:MAG TPA: SHOCT domain-containing protein [Anaerolineales bacterium]|nr:SHOCT domain-containing protein [Anaerolineales bacterium]
MMHGIGFNFWGVVMMFLFWGALIALAIGLIRLLFPSAPKHTFPPSPQESTAQEILDRRYAQGEITREEYQQIKLDLEK